MRLRSAGEKTARNACSCLRLLYKHGPLNRRTHYAALFACCALTRAHLALVAAMILLRPSADNLRFLGATIVAVAAACGGFRNFAHLARWA